MSSTPVEVTRTGQHVFTATNPRGAEVAIGPEDAPGAFTPGELLLAAIAACSAVTSENLLVRRLGEDAKVTVHADRTKTPEDKHKFASVQVSLDVDLSGFEDGERGRLVDAVRRAIEKYCTVSRSVEEGTPIQMSISH
ncbi:OsmC family protein [Saccharopolyspora phatthalungensis]|uniref:Putative OsmC-like protein n=1 Tax=Saccharopolyspora phatthalungensis TaxID=664693 RepID=A0A840Q1Q2_9PSEU|nr:OsmC family protein [Saccharopolyspora phatthalungensis]MBB5152718.1 putative OsmC-like protein [Saccharopolyspora phatthalungensis]